MYRVASTAFPRNVPGQFTGNVAYFEDEKAVLEEIGLRSDDWKGVPDRPAIEEAIRQRKNFTIYAPFTGTNEDGIPEEMAWICAGSWSVA